MNQHFQYRKHFLRFLVLFCCLFYFIFRCVNSVRGIWKVWGRAVAHCQPNYTIKPARVQPEQPFMESADAEKHVVYSIVLCLKITQREEGTGKGVI